MNQESPNLSEKIKKIAETSASSTPDEPDEQTAVGITQARQERQKSMSAGVRADQLRDQLIATLTEEIDRLRSVYDTQQEELAGYADTRERLARLESPHVLRKSLVAGCGLLAATGAVLVSVYPQDGTATLIGLKSPTLFGAGIALLMTSAVFSFIFAIKA